MELKVIRLRMDKNNDKVIRKQEEREKGKIENGRVDRRKGKRYWEKRKIQT